MLNFYVFWLIFAPFFCLVILKNFFLVVGQLFLCFLYFLLFLNASYFIYVLCWLFCCFLMHVMFFYANFLCFWILMTFLPVVSRQFWGVGLIFHPPAVPLALNNLQSILKIATSSCFQLFSFKPCLACHNFPLHFHLARKHQIFVLSAKKLILSHPLKCPNPLN